MPFAGVSEFTDAEIDSPAVDSESVRGLAQQAKRLARDHKTFFDFFASVSRDPWWGPSGPMAADRRRPSCHSWGRPLLSFCRKEHRHG